MTKFELDHEDYGVKYLYSLYWSVVTLMTVGYGDITASNANEAAFATIMCMLGCGMYSYSINEIGMIL